MKLLMLCIECPMLADNPQEVLNYVELRDDAYYDFECSRGHRRLIVLTEPKFAVLFESGAMALLDGYTREAVSSFAASLERFYEYWIRAVLLAGGTSPETLDACWSLVAAQSERQFGAFCVLYQREHGRLPTVLSNKMVQFRNDVIHRGYIPPRAEVIAYASDALKLIVNLHVELYETRYKGISTLMGIELGRAYGRVPEGIQLSSASIATMFTDVAGSKGQMSFEMALAELDRRREGFYTR